MPWVIPEGSSIRKQLSGVQAYPFASSKPGSATFFDKISGLGHAHAFELGHPLNATN